MTYCSNCGSGIQTDALFCPECGAKAEKPELPLKTDSTPVKVERIPTQIMQVEVINTTPIISYPFENEPKQFCRNCGKEVAAGSYACMGCGLPPMKAFNFCPSCGSNCHQDAVICIKCGINLESQDSVAKASSPIPEIKKTYCRNCGKDVLKDAVACLNCGLPPGKSKNFCYACGSESHNEAIICIKCGAGLEQATTIVPQQTFLQQVPKAIAPVYNAGPTQTNNILIVGNQKSVGTAFLLAFLFGPLGLLYASVSGGIIMVFITIIVGTVTLGAGLIIIWIVCIIWAVSAASNANQAALDRGNSIINKQNQ